MILRRGGPVRGFTVLEMSVASFILVLFFGGVYKLFSTISRAHSAGSWINATTIEIRNGLNLLRQEISRATPPKMVTQQGGEDFGTPEYKKLYFPSKTRQEGLKFPRAPGSPNVSLLKFFMCQPGRKGIVGEAEMEPEIIQGLLTIKGNSLVYNRTIISQDPSVASKTGELTQIICRNVDQVAMEIMAQGGGAAQPEDLRIVGRDPTQIDPTTAGFDEKELSVKRRNFLRIHLVSIHPRYRDTKVEETLDTPFEVVAEEGGKLDE